MAPAESTHQLTDPQTPGGPVDPRRHRARCSRSAGLFRLLRGLASVGTFEETAPRRFALTPLAELLRSDHPQSLRQFARPVGDEHYLGWADLLYGVRSGEGAFRHRYGMSMF